MTVQYATSSGTASAGSDYQTRNGTVTLLAGRLTQTITVPLIGDTVGELDETFFVTLSNPSGAVLGNSQAIGTILDDDNLTISDTSITEGDDGSVLAVFTVALAVPQSRKCVSTTPRPTAPRPRGSITLRPAAR